MELTALIIIQRIAIISVLLLRVMGFTEPLFPDPSGGGQNERR